MGVSNGRYLSLPPKCILCVSWLAMEFDCRYSCIQTCAKFSILHELNIPS